MWKQRRWKKGGESPPSTTLSVAQTRELHRKTILLMKELYSVEGDGEQPIIDASQPLYFAKHTSKQRG